jgi:hypothetical protein
MRRDVNASAEGRSYDERHFRLSAKHVVDFGRLIRYLIHGECRQVAEHDFRDWSHACYGSTNRGAHYGGFAYGSVSHSVVTKFLSQASSYLEGAFPVATYVLA